MVMESIPGTPGVRQEYTMDCLGQVSQPGWEGWQPRYCPLTPGPVLRSDTFLLLLIISNPGPIWFILMLDCSLFFGVSVENLTLKHKEHSWPFCSKTVSNFIRTICTPVHSCNHLINQLHSSSPMRKNHMDTSQELQPSNLFFYIMAACTNSHSLVRGFQKRLSFVLTKIKQ